MVYCIKERPENTGQQHHSIMRCWHEDLERQYFHRLRAFNLCQLCDFILTRLEDYYIRRIMDVANNRLSGYSSTSRFYPDHKNVDLDSVEKVSGNSRIGVGYFSHSGPYSESWSSHNEDFKSGSSWLLLNVQPKASFSCVCVKYAMSYVPDQPLSI